CRLLTPCTSSGSPMMSSRFLRGLSEPNGSWNTSCISLRSGLSSASRSLATSMTSPSAVRNKTSPDVGSIARSTHFAVVVLPQPLSPPRLSISPSLTAKDTSSTALTLPTVRLSGPPLTGKYFLRFFTSSSGARASATLGPLYLVVVQEAGHGRSGVHRDERWHVHVAPAGHEVGAAGVEGAALRAM